MKLQGITQEGLRKLAKAVKTAKEYRVYEAFENPVGGVEPAGAEEDYIDATSAEEAARLFWGKGWSDADDSTVIVATDDEGDSYHFKPLREASKIAQEKNIQGIEFYWDDGSDSGDPGWVFLDQNGDPQAVVGLEGRDPNASDEELWEAFLDTPKSAYASKTAQEEWVNPFDQFEEEEEIEMPDAEELVLYIDNTYELYNQKQSIEKNLLKKMERGVYDPSMAPKLWGYLVTEGAKRYVQEMEGYDMPWHKVFPPQVRQEAAQQMASYFEELAEAGEYSLENY